MCNKLTNSITIELSGVQKAVLSDLPYIEMLRRREGEAIGFIPMQRYEMEIDGRSGGSILICWENGDPVGFLYATHNRAGVTHIQQVAIQEDARRLERATALVVAAQREKDWLVTLRCAADLDATSFWEALGFALESHVGPKSAYGRSKDKATVSTRRKRDILRFQKVVGGLWLPVQ
jgi:hypothetical protein